MPFKFESIWASISAMWTLIWSFTRMTPHVSLQLTQFHRHIITICTPMRLLMCMPANKITWRRISRLQEIYLYLTCLTSSPLVVKLASQYLHLCGLVPVWVFTWFCRLANVLKPLSHTEHLCGLSSE